MTQVEAMEEIVRNYYEERYKYEETFKGEMDLPGSDKRYPLGHGQILQDLLGALKKQEEIRKQEEKGEIYIE